MKDNNPLPLLTELIEYHLGQERSVPVRPPVEPAVIRERLNLSLGPAEEDLDALHKLLRGILDHTPSTSSPRFFNQLFGGRDGLGMVGDMLAAFLNNSMYTYKLTGVHTLIELEVIAQMGRWMGFENADGVCTPGGSISNLMGMLLARNRACEHARQRGFDGRTLRIYTSSESHYSVRKAAGVLGIGRDNTVVIGVDNRGRMRPDALKAAIVKDKAAGYVPVMINATSGTTVLGSFDPLEAIADIAESEDVWLHIDAAYGGTMVFHPDFRADFGASGRADSVTWDAHKLMGVPLTCSAILVREPGLLDANLRESASYLFQSTDQGVDLGNRSLQCGRRNDALKIWLAWKAYGDDGFAQRMIRLRELTLYAQACVESDAQLRLTRKAESINLCFEVIGVDAADCCHALNTAGEIMVGHAMVGDTRTVRLVLVNPSLTEADIDTFFEKLLETATQLAN